MHPNKIGPRSALLALCLGLASRCGLAAQGEPTLPPEALEFVRRALPDGLEQDAGDGRALFNQVLAGPAFVRGAAGLFDVHVFVGDELSTEREARKLLNEVLKTLQPAADVVSERWPEGGDGLISAARLQLVLVEPGADGACYPQILALLDQCEKLGYSGWAPDGAVDTPENRSAEIARTWEVQVHNLSHPSIVDRRKQWIEHGVGHYALSFVANRALLQGAWGLVPPWLANGLIDELDISAYGQAWVGQESSIAPTPGWYRPGWSGFLPTGAQPPPVLGPPAALTVKVKRNDEPWLDYEASRTRHWTNLSDDLESEDPVSFAYAAEYESFLPRDRAAARCLLALMLEVAPGKAGSLTALLDHPMRPLESGMPDSEPLAVIFARALGGVPEVDRLESLTTRALLEEIGRADIIERLTALTAERVLELSDHREQSRWLHGEPRFSWDDRVTIFNSILEIEHAQQMAEWKALSRRLDRALAAALGAGRTYPVKSRDVAKVAEAFRAGLASDPARQADGDSKRARTAASRARR